MKPLAPREQPQRWPQPLVSEKSSLWRAQIQSHLNHSPLHCDSAGELTANSSVRCDGQPSLSRVTAAPGTVPPLSPSRATVQYKSGPVFGGEHHVPLDLPRRSNYNAVCWCLWGPAVHVLAALTCCSRQISCSDPGAGWQPQVGQR